MAFPEPYNPDVGEYICTRLSTSKDSLAKITKEKYPGMPSLRQVYYWLNNNPEFVTIYSVAREQQGQFLADEIVDIADDSHLDVIIDEEGKARVDGEAVRRSALRVDTRKWAAAKLYPKKYGDRVDHEVTVTPHEDWLALLK